eukprot:2823412-Prymnesium_polylepis.1
MRRAGHTLDVTPVTFTVRLYAKYAKHESLEVLEACKCTPPVRTKVLHESLEACKCTPPVRFSSETVALAPLPPKA